jgi:hypothetical protein
VVTSHRFEQRVGLNIAVALSRAESLINLLTEVTAGKIGIIPVGVRPIFPEK